MREIRFRAWDKKYKIMVDIDGCDLYLADGKIFEVEERSANYSVFMYKKDVTDNYELMQYTGINDKDGKEIYEGDIVKDEYSRWFIVFWRDTDAGYWIRKYNEEEVFPLHLGIRIIVIGNEYENPELLEVK